MCEGGPERTDMSGTTFVQVSVVLGTNDLLSTLLAHFYDSCHDGIVLHNGKSPQGESSRVFFPGGFIMWRFQP